MKNTFSYLPVHDLYCMHIEPKSSSTLMVPLQKLKKIIYTVNAHNYRFLAGWEGLPVGTGAEGLGGVTEWEGLDFRGGGLAIQYKDH